MECRGFLFDLDGTLVDSLAVVERAWADWARRRGIDPAEVLAFVHGKQAVTSLRHFMPGAGDEDIRREFGGLEKAEARDTHGVVAMPGALALLQRLERLSIPWAIVTSGTVPIAHARHRAARLPRPAVFITAEQVARGKPAPDAYLLGARRLGLPPAQCVVVEDAAAGIRSGLAAGCRVIAVNAPADTPELARVAGVLHSLAQIDVGSNGRGAIVSVA